MKSRKEKRQKKVESEESRVTRKKIHTREMLGKSRIAVFFQWFVVPDVKSRLATAAGAEVAVPQGNEKWHTAVAWSAFSSQNVQNTPGPEPLKHLRAGPILKFRSREMACRCGAKHVCNSKCAKHHIRGAIFEVTIGTNCARLWREAHLQLKMWKNWGGSGHFLKLRCPKISQLES